jgi:chromosome segregation ATPase
MGSFDQQMTPDKLLAGLASVFKDDVAYAAERVERIQELALHRKALEDEVRLLSTNRDELKELIAKHHAELAAARSDLKAAKGEAEKIRSDTQTASAEILARARSEGAGILADYKKRAAIASAALAGE